MNIAIGLLLLVAQDWDAIRARGVVIRNEGDGWRAIRPDAKRTAWYFHSSLGAKRPLVLDRGQVVLLSTEHYAIVKLDSAGRVLWSVKELPSVYDPLPALTNGNILVYGTGNFIWPAYPDHSDYVDQSERRFIEARSLATGKLLWSKPFFVFGLPIYVANDLVVTIRPKQVEKWLLKPAIGRWLAFAYRISDGKETDRREIRASHKNMAALNGDFGGYEAAENDGHLYYAKDATSPGLDVRARLRSTKVEVLINGSLVAVLRPPTTIGVQVRGSGKRARAVARLLRQPLRSATTLKLPKGWWPINSEEDDAAGGNRASVLSVAASPTPTFLVRAWRASGVYGYTGVIPFRLAGGQWIRIGPKRPIEFSDRGSFCLRGDHLLVWDIEYIPRTESHNSPHRYVVRDYRITSKGFAEGRRLKTKRKYAPWLAAGGKDWQDGTVSPGNDPLRELGLKWQWWAEPLNSR